MQTVNLADFSIFSPLLVNRCMFCQLSSTDNRRQFVILRKLSVHLGLQHDGRERAGLFVTSESVETCS